MATGRDSPVLLSSWEGVLEREHRRDGINAVDTLKVLTYKLAADSTIVRYKARVINKGFM
jgi:predicted HAD superfamily phosphohydrolase